MQDSILGYSPCRDMEQINNALSFKFGDPEMDYEGVFKSKKIVDTLDGFLFRLQPSQICFEQFARINKIVNALSRNWSRKHVPLEIKSIMETFLCDFVALESQQSFNEGEALKPKSVKQIFHFRLIESIFCDATPKLRRDSQLLVINGIIMQATPFRHAMRVTPLIKMQNQDTTATFYLKMGIAQPLTDQESYSLQQNGKMPRAINESNPPKVVIYLHVCSMKILSTFMFHE